MLQGEGQKNIKVDGQQSTKEEKKLQEPQAKEKKPEEIKKEDHIIPPKESKKNQVYGTKAEALKAIEDNLQLVYDTAFSYFTEEKEAIKKIHLVTLSQHLNTICNYDFSRLPDYLLLNSKKEDGFILYDDFIKITKEWLDPEAKKLIVPEKIEEKNENLTIFQQAFQEKQNEIKKLYQSLLLSESKSLELTQLANFIQNAFDLAEIDLLKEGKEKSEPVIIASITDFIKGLAKELNYEIIQSSIEKYISTNKDVTLIKRMAKIKSENTEINNDLEIQLKATITQYEQLSKKQEMEGKDSTAAKNMISLLEKQLKQYKGIPERNNTENLPTVSKSLDIKANTNINQELREKTIQEIFYFYCRQQFQLGRKPTFDQRNKVLSHMNLGEFMKFCIDFQIPLKQDKIKALFKKYARLSKELDLLYFKILLQKIANAISDEKCETLKAEANRLRKTKQKKENLNSNLKELTIREGMTEKEKIEELFILLEIDQAGKHREKMNGIAVQFITPEKKSRYSLQKNIFYSEKKAEDIRREVDFQRKQRLANKIAVEQEEKERNDRNKEILKRIYVEQNKKRQGVLIGLKTKMMEKARIPTYKEIKNRQLGIPIDSQQITWKLLKTLSFHDIGATSTDDQFTPSDLINESKEEDKEEDIILKKLERGMNESNTRTSQLLIAKEFGLNERMHPGRKSVPPRVHSIPESKLSREKKSNIYGTNNYLKNKVAAKMHNMSAELINQANQYDYAETLLKNEKYNKILKLHDHKIQKRRNLVLNK